MIWLILILATILRLISSNQSLWLDEAINVLSAKNLDFISFVSRYPIADFHPPGYFAILWVWSRLFGFSEIAVRAPSVIFGLGTIFITYLIGKNLFEQKVGLIAAFLLSLAPLHIYYSQEARMYSFAAFAATLSMYFMIGLLKNKKYAFWGYALSVSLVLYSDYVTYFIFFPQIFYVVLFYKEYLGKFILALGVGGISFLPWILVFPEQLANGQQTASSLTGWKNVVGGASLKDGALLVIKTLIGRISIEDKTLYTIIVGVVSLPYLFVSKNIFTKQSHPLLFWLITPPLLAFLFSFYIPIFSYFRFIFILPAFYLLIALGVEKIKNKRLGQVLLLLIVLFEIAASSIYLINPKFHREDWKGAVSFAKQRIEDGGMVLLESDDLFLPYLYYSQSFDGAIGGLAKIPAKSTQDIKEFNNQVKGKDVYLFEYLVDITDPKRLLGGQLESYGYKKTSTYNFNGVGFVYLYQASLLK